MNPDKYKREYKYKSQEGAHGGINKWIIIIGGALVILIAYLVNLLRS